MNKYIIELLKLESTVIIPNFGALMKSGKSLIFNSILKYNDQKLEKYIAKKEGRDIQEVSNMVAKHVREIIAIIEKGDEYPIYGLGSFYKAANGKIAIKVEGAEKAEPEQTEIPPVLEQKPVKENVVKSLYPKTDAPKDSSITKEKLMESVYAADEKKEKTPAPKATIIKVKEEEIIPKEKKKKKKGLVWLILILLLAGGGTFVGLNLEKVKAWSGFTPTEIIEDVEGTKSDIPVSTEETDPEEELMIIDSAEIYEDTTTLVEEMIDSEEEVIEEEEIVEEEILPADNSFNYHVVVGSFGSESNANALVKKMKKKGFNTAQVLGKYGSLYKVAASSHATKQEAIDAINDAKSINEDAYVQKADD